MIPKGTNYFPPDKNKRVTMRDREGGTKHDVPSFVRGRDATPESLGEDDLAWAMARKLAEKIYEAGIPSGKSEAYLYYKFKAGLDKTRLRQRYSTQAFTDSKSKVIPLPDFGRRIVAYFWDHYGWAYESSVEGIIGMATDPVMIDDVTRALQKRYANMRLMSGNRKLAKKELQEGDRNWRH
jgi:hypothetical protein